MKFIKKFVRIIFSSLGIKVFRENALPWGIDVFHDINKICGLDSIRIVFDVGANVGQSSKVYLEKFPKSLIFSFEPVSATFSQLVENTKNNERVKCLNLALGEKLSKVVIPIQEKSTLNSLSAKRNENLNSYSKLEKIQIETLDSILLKLGVSCIDFIKIDTEGYEMEVLKGGLDALKKNKIKLIQLELGIKNHIRTTFYNHTQEYLNSLGYEVLGFYKQSQSLYTKSRFLMHSDVLFINAEWSKLLRPKFVKSFDFD
ncbi:FkbM family methyltransferase [Algoriphagus mannitolivorans]|uniref:FkbM family methyltransferase n=1 Tax=Algoriphagus mannitolivorans TaxID=226504 RepID=UPI00040931AA|nr:FkbM family methyltransferase [Algoriphagus mannitolivorans]